MGMFLSLSVLAGCQQHDGFAGPPRPTLADLDGQYREKNALNGERPLADEADEALEDLNYSELSVQNGRLSFRRQSASTLENREDSLGEIVQDEKGGFEIKPQAGLDELARTRPELKVFQDWFANGARVRLLPTDRHLRITRVQGTQRISQSWVRVTDPRGNDPQNQPFEKAKAKARELAELRQAFLERWQGQDMALFESVTEEFSRGRLSRVRVRPGGKIPDEESLSGPENEVLPKKQLNFKRLKITGPGSAVVNGQHPVQVRFYMTVRRQLPKDGQALAVQPRSRLFVRLVSGADANLYMSTVKLGLIEDDGANGFRLSRRAPRSKGGSDRGILRYQRQGTNTATPTPPFPPADQDDKNEDPGEDAVVTPKPTAGETARALRQR
ncbi:MAG: hypothetical protein KF802_14250 [Bdellovibrionaceae bacterium]|nr:hypothetical protein [Pseudobdellovibrionaceae bacterium]